MVSNNLVEIEDGMTENESVTRSVRSAIEAAVYELILQGDEKGFWTINWPVTEKVIKDKIEEVILATSATVEGQTTAYYIQNSLKQTNTKITKLAQGLPVGGEIEQLDDGTLYSAFKNRVPVTSE